MIEKELKRQQLVEQYREKRAQLKKEGNYAELAKLPRDSSPSRLTNRCQVTGRPRSVYRKFNLSRIAFRELAHKGQIPGVKKSSW